MKTLINHRDVNMIASNIKYCRSVLLSMKLLAVLNFTLLLFLVDNKAHARTPINERTITAQLTLADNSRLSAPKKFSELLLSLTERQSSLSVEQRHFLTYLQGYHFAYIGEHDKSVTTLSGLLEQEISTLLRYRVITTLVNVSAINQHWSEGLKYIKANKKLLPEIKQMKYVETSFLTTILFYTQLKQYRLALSYIEQLKQLGSSASNQCFVTRYELQAKYNLQNLKADELPISAALTLCEGVKSNLGASSIRVDQAKRYLNEQQPDKALALLLPYADKVNNTYLPMLLAMMNNVLAKAYFQLDDIDEAKKYLADALEQNKHNTGVQRTMNSYELLYKIAEQEQNLPLAYQYFKKFSALNKAYLDENHGKHLAFQLAEHDALEKESQIKLLNEKNNLLVSNQDLASAEIANTQLAIIVLVLVIILLVVWGTRLYQAHRIAKVLSEYDALTGIYNRRHFTHVANVAIEYCKSAQQDLSLIMFDLDYFKQVNDNHGHLTGDWALKAAAEACKLVGRKNDIFARIGGEEFCLILPSCNIYAARIRAEACRVAIENIITEKSGCNFTMTASFGLTDVTRSGFDLHKLLKDADIATYRAKYSGRNTVCVFEKETPEAMSDDVEATVSAST